MRWFLLLVVLVALAVGVPTLTARADTSAGVVITVSGNVSGVLGLPSGFTITYIDDCSMQMTWTKGIGSTNTMIRAAVGVLPADRNDGRLVYYGNGTQAVDVWCSTTAQKPVYFRAWSESSTGNWTSGSTDSNQIGGRTMTLLGLFAFCGILSWLSIRSNFFLLKLLAGMSWVAMFLYVKGYPPGAIPEGSPVHIAILMILIGLGLAIPLYGLGREISRQQSYGEGGSETSGGFRFSRPEWTQSSTAKFQKRKQRRMSDLEEYRERFHKALNPNEGNRRY